MLEIVRHGKRVKMVDDPALTTGCGPLHTLARPTDVEGNHSLAVLVCCFEAPHSRQSRVFLFIVGYGKGQFADVSLIAHQCVDEKRLARCLVDGHPRTAEGPSRAIVQVHLHAVGRRCALGELQGTHPFGREVGQLMCLIALYSIDRSDLHSTDTNMVQCVEIGFQSGLIDGRTEPPPTGAGTGLGQYKGQTSIERWLHHSRIFRSAEQPATRTIVLEVRHLVIAERLSGRRILTRALVPTEEAVGMYAGHKCPPGLVAGRPIVSGGEQSVAYAPAHAVEEERRARHLRTAIGSRRVKADIPEAVGTLTVQQRLGHCEEVLLQQLVFFRVVVEDIHAPQQGRVDPTVAPAPIAVVAILLTVWWHIVLIAPPQSVLFVEESPTAGVAAPQIAVDGIVEIAAVAGKTVILHIHRHSHLYGIDPCPIVIASGSHLVFKVSLDATDHQRVARHSVALKISLSATLVVGIGGGYAVAWRPVVEGAPPVSIIEIALSRVDGVECHKPLVVHGACPQRARPHLLHKGRPRRVGIYRHEAVVDTAGQSQHAVGAGLCQQGQGAQETEKQG